MPDVTQTLESDGDLDALMEQLAASTARARSQLDSVSRQ